MPTKNKPFEHKFTSALGTAQAPAFKFGKNSEGEVLVYLPLMPLSPFNTKDSRSGITFLYDVDTLNATSFKGGVMLPLDIEHNTECGMPGLDTRARGRFGRIVLPEHVPEAALPEGWSFTETLLNDLGQVAIGQHHYLYTSAVAEGVWLDENTVQFTRLKSNTLTNNPANAMPNNPDLPAVSEAMTASPQGALHEETNDTNRMDLATLIALLGLPADADEAAVTAELTALAAGKTAAADATVQMTAAKSDAEAIRVQLTAAQTELTTVKAELSAIKTAEASRAAEAAVDGVIAARKATPAQRDGLLENARNDLAKFNAQWVNAVAVIPDNTPVAQGGGDTTFGLTESQRETATKAGLTYEQFAAALAATTQALGA